MSGGTIFIFLLLFLWARGVPDFNIGNEELENREVPLPRRYHGANFRGSFIFQKVNDKAMNNQTFLTTRN